VIVELDIDIEKKNVKLGKIPDEIDPIEFIMILNSVQNQIVMGIKAKTAKQVEVVEPKLIIPGQ
jgi:hypothetical protein